MGVRILVIGYPGDGKTTVANCIKEAIERHGAQVVVISDPSDIAAAKPHRNFDVLIPLLPQPIEIEEVQIDPSRNLTSQPWKHAFYGKDRNKRR